MKKIVLAILLFFTPLISATTITNVEIVNSFQAGETTPEQVIEKLGKPININKNPNGQFIYFYDFDLPNIKKPSKKSTKGIVAFIFDKNSKLIQPKFFKDESR
ncbi:MAG: hypothetical protein QM500_10385 [Methylococcales bacterium]